MRNLLKIRKLAFIALFALIGTSCNDDDNDVAPVDNTITGIATRNANLSILVQALVKADLDATLQGSGQFTVFAPTNAAFTSFLSDNGFATLDEVPTAALKEILLNHVVNGSFQSTALSTGYIKTLAKSSASGTNTLSLFVDTSSGVILNGVAMVTTADVTASNGVIHIVDEVIELPTIVTHATANPNFSSLVEVLTSAGQPDFVSILSGDGPFTVFAPTNAAILALDDELAPIGGIAGVSTADLTKVLKYHVTEGNILAASLTDGQVVTTLQIPQTFTIQLTGGPKIMDVNDRLSNIIFTDVQCANGVIHVLDRVLLPAF